MDIKLTKDGEERTIKYGPTLFPALLFVPVIGVIAAFIMWFKRGQFKELFCQLIILLAITFACTISATVLYGIMPQMAAGLVFVTLMGWWVMSIYLMASSVKNANMWRLKTLIKLGYEVENEQVYKIALQYKKPKWLFFCSF